MGNEALVPPSRGNVSFLRTKIWRVPLSNFSIRDHDERKERWDADYAIVLFRHDAQTGEKKLVMDGKLIHRSKDMLDGGDMLKFELAGKSCRLEVVHFPGLTDYLLYYDDIRIHSVMEETAHTFDKLKVRIPRAHVSSGPHPTEGRRFVFFDITTQLGGATYSVSRRFSEVDELDCLVRSAFKGHHLEGSLPPLPNKQFKLLNDHFDQQFIQNRRSQLEVYLKRLVAVPHASLNPDLLEFLGVSSRR